MRLKDFQRLDKELGLFDVYVICVGAMISSGFFLLPGIAVSYSGPSAVLAYLLAGLLIVPAMLSQAELATAMPRAGGTYYFLDRTLGPLVGTIGGVGTWLTLVLKSAFALIGMGAYLALIFDLPIALTAVVSAVLIAAINAMGTKETSGLLRIFVLILLMTLAVFLLQGLASVLGNQSTNSITTAFDPLFPHGLDGVLEAVGLVFVSFIGLTKVASLAEEVRDPDRNIPLGMTLGLLTVTLVYVVGVFVMIAVLGVDRLSTSLTPVADTAGEMGGWLPGRFWYWLMVGAGILAFASMANAGVMAASRYPLAMARDRIFPDRFAATGRRGTPLAAIVFTTIILVLSLLTLEVQSVAKLASALQLLLFALVNVAVIVMRESRIESYDPGFRAPFYPWLQLAGIFLALILVAEMGWLSVLFTVGVTVACVGWFNHYARKRIARDGAIFHVFERLGRRRFAGLDRELRDILKEKGLRKQDPFDEVVARCVVLDYQGVVRLGDLVTKAAQRLSGRCKINAEDLAVGFGAGQLPGDAAIGRGAALLHTRLPGLESSELVLARCPAGVQIGEEKTLLAGPGDGISVHMVICLVSGQGDAGRHLRILAQLASRAEDPDFIPTWLGAGDEQDLKEILLRNERYRTLRVQRGTATEVLIDVPLTDLHLPTGSVIALLGRSGRAMVPRGHILLVHGDRLTILGTPKSLRALAERFPEEHHTTGDTGETPLPLEP